MFCKCATAAVSALRSSASIVTEPTSALHAWSLFGLPPNASVELDGKLTTLTDGVEAPLAIG